MNNYEDNLGMVNPASLKSNVASDMRRYDESEVIPYAEDGITHTLQYVQEALHRTENLISLLEKKINPILQLEGPIPAKDNNKRNEVDSRSGMRAELMALYSRLFDVNDRLNTLMERVDL